jgi:4'-phosphopantetheinyl transferase
MKYSGLPFDIVYDVLGKPFFDNDSAIRFSISHTFDYIAIAFDKNDVGIDIEHIRTGKEAIVKRFFTDEEKEYLFALPYEKFDAAFTQLWTLKEAYSKCVGTGINGSFATQTIDLSSLKARNRETEFAFTSFFEAKSELFVAVCVKEC